jgi:hypothetical protein
MQSHRPRKVESCNLHKVAFEFFSRVTYPRFRFFGGHFLRLHVCPEIFSICDCLFACCWSAGLDIIVSRSDPSPQPRLGLDSTTVHHVTSILTDSTALLSPFSFSVLLPWSENLQRFLARIESHTMIHSIYILWTFIFIVPLCRAPLCRQTPGPQPY